MRTRYPVFVGRIFFACCLFILTLLPAFARQQEGTEVRPANSAPVLTKPGTVVAIGVKVSNTTTLKKSYQSSLLLPQGWKIVTRDFPFELQPSESDVRLVSFSIPADAPAQTYELRYVIQAGTSSRQEVTCNIIVTVAPVIDLELKLLNAPRFAVSGSTFGTDFLLTNKGNSNATLKLRIRSSQNFTVQTDVGTELESA